MRIGKMVMVAASMLAIGLAASGCATKKFVNEQIAPLSSRVGAHDQRIEQLDKTAHEALDRATAAGMLAEGKFLYSMVLSDDGVRFQTGKAGLSDEAIARLQQFAQRLNSENKNVYVEIQGHTDSTGSPEINYRLGLDRAEAVRRYLNQQGVALNRMSTISYGADAPVQPNDTREGRTANRRVVLIVLA